MLKTDTTLRDLAPVASDSQSLKSLGWRTVLFFAPLLGFLGVSLAALQLSGELSSPARIVERQKSQPVIYYPMYQPKSVYPVYKLFGAIRRQPEILVLGSSRTFSIRSEFLATAQGRFYNAGIFGGTSVAIMRAFLERLPEDHLPKVLVLDLDPWWFRKGAPVDVDAAYFEPSSPLDIANLAWRSGVHMMLQPSLYFANPLYVGVNAKLQRSGLRPDGSFLAGERWLDKQPNLLEKQLMEMDVSGGPNYYYALPEVSREATLEVQQILAYASAHGISVIGYASPLHPAVYQALNAVSATAHYKVVVPGLTSLFAKYGAHLTDLQDPATTGCTAAEFLDAFHESEVCSARVLIALASRDAKANALVDVSRLKGYLENRISSWQLGF